MENARFIESKSLFKYPIWNNINNNNFGFIVILDRDNSLVDHDILNEDMAYIIIKLPGDFFMTKKETMTITLFPSSGIEITTTLKAPPPIKPVVSFE